MENQKEKKKKFILILIILLGIISLTIAATYAIFRYSQEGKTDNIIKTGTIMFLYTEIDQQGSGISIENAFPMSDAIGKVQTESNTVFNFKIESESGNIAVPYEITARKKSTSTLDESALKLYLTEVNGNTETELLLNNYNDLIQTTVSVPTGIVEKTIYFDTILADSSYSKDFRLRMWIDEDTDFSDGSYNNKTFTITVNVYASTSVVKIEDN